MRILNWVQSKLGGGHEKKRVDDAGFTHHVLQETRKEEFSDWPQGLLAIGTFGNTEIEEPNAAAATTTAEPEMSDFTLEEVTQLQKELTKVLARKPVMSDDDKSQGEKIRPNNLLPLDKFLNCPSSLEVDRIDRARLDSSSSQNVDGDPPRNGGGVVLSKGGDGVSDERSLIRRRSVSFLLKKVFACRSGFETVPASLRDPTPPEPRMERLMRALLHKKIYPQSSSPRSGGKKYLEGKATEDKTPRSSSDGSKWVRTDSEYIVLEI